MTNSISKMFNINGLSIVLLAISIIGSLCIYDVYTRSESQLAEAEKNVLEESKKITKSDVQSLLSFIDKRRDLFHKNALDLIKNQTQEAHAIASSLFKQYKDTKSLQEIKDLVREVLRLKRFNNGRGYFFATNLNGVEELFADRPQLEGKNLINMRDTKGNYVIRDMIKIAKTKGEGFYEYYWTKPGVSGNDHKKVSYIKYFEPFDWFIGTGEYYEDLEEDIKKEILTFLNNIKISFGNYIFVYDYEGNCLSHINKDLIGKNLIGLKDKDGIFFIRELINVARSTKGDFIRYYFEKPNGNKDTLPKISYVTNYEPWQVVIGSGFYVDDIYAIVKTKQENIKKEIFNKIQTILLVVIFLLFFVFVINKVFHNKLNEGIKVFNTFFKRAAENKEIIDINRLYFKEFKDLAIEANRMTDKRIAAELELEEMSNEYKTLFDNMLDGFALHLMIFDKDGKPKDYKFISVNKAFERLTGIKAKDIIGKTVLEVMPDTEYYWIETYGNVVKTGEPVHFENFSVAFGKYFEVTAYKHGDEKFACIFVDITQRVLMYKSLEELTRNLEEKVKEEVEKRRKQELLLIQQSKLASMAEMLISISHHWRQPLNAIGLVVQSLENLYDNDELTKEQIQWIINTVMDRITSMSNTINSFSTYFNKQTVTDTFDVESSIQKTYNIVFEDFNINKINLSLSFLEPQKSPADLSSYNTYSFISGDANNFQQVLLAILNNSKEAILTQQKKENKEFFVSISLDVTQQNIVIKIEDNGGGINPEIMDRIF
ncbi:MAG: cache domain-containing protein, partial [Thermodesulfovibrionales bacterium]|nr:cache domain-containing protein [Thermodesulfovibrionales bacterium]